MNEIRDELRKNLKENFNFKEEAPTWELIEFCYFGPDENYLSPEKKPSIKYVKDFCIKFYERYREVKFKKDLLKN